MVVHLNFSHVLTTILEWSLFGCMLQFLVCKSMLINFAHSRWRNGLSTYILNDMAKLTQIKLGLSVIKPMIKTSSEWLSVWKSVLWGVDFANTSPVSKNRWLMWYSSQGNTKICSYSAIWEFHPNSLPNHSHLRSAAYGGFLPGSAMSYCFKACVQYSIHNSNIARHKPP